MEMIRFLWVCLLFQEDVRDVLERMCIVISPGSITGLAKSSA